MITKEVIQRTLEKLLNLIEELDLQVKEIPLRSADGRILGKNIALRKGLCNCQKKCVLAEEIGHYVTGVGNILDQSKTENRKQELKARAWAYNHQIGLEGLIQAYQKGYRTAQEIAEYLEVTEEFLLQAIEYYKNKYGLYYRIGNDVIQFEPYLEIYNVSIK